MNYNCKQLIYSYLKSEISIKNNSLSYKLFINIYLSLHFFLV